jgi:hypothetical protein
MTRMPLWVLINRRIPLPRNCPPIPCLSLWMDTVKQYRQTWTWTVWMLSYSLIMIMIAASGPLAGAPGRGPLTGRFPYSYSTSILTPSRTRLGLGDTRRVLLVVTVWWWEVPAWVTRRFFKLYISVLVFTEYMNLNVRRSRSGCMIYNYGVFISQPARRRGVRFPDSDD